MMVEKIQLAPTKYFELAWEGQCMTMLPMVVETLLCMVAVGG